MSNEDKFVGVAVEGPTDQIRINGDGSVDARARLTAHEALDVWLDQCGENPVAWDHGNHVFKLEAAVAGYDDDRRAVWAINLERRVREEL